MNPDEEKNPSDLSKDNDLSVYVVPATPPLQSSAMARPEAASVVKKANSVDTSLPLFVSGDAIPLQTTVSLPPSPDRQSSISIEGARRTSRGELFRQPPHFFAPSQPGGSKTLDFGKESLQGKTYATDEELKELLRQIADETKGNARAQCWTCNSLALTSYRWNTNDPTFGEIGVVFCEVCGAWTVL